MSQFNVEEKDRQNGLLGIVSIEADSEIVGMAYDHETDNLWSITNFVEPLFTADATSFAFAPERGNGDIINLNIINVDDHPGDISIAYGRVGDGDQCIEKMNTVHYKNIKPEDFINLNQENITPFGPDGWLWATVEGNIKFVAGASESFLASKIQETYYPLWPINSFSKKLDFPFFADNYRKLVSLLQIQNFSTETPASVTVEFNCIAYNNIRFQAITKPITIKPKFAFQIKEPSSMEDLFEPGKLMYPNSWCAGVITSDQPVAAFIKEISRDPDFKTRVDYDAKPFPTGESGIIETQTPQP